VRDLDRGEPDAARAAVHQDFFARRKPAKVVQRVVCGEERRLHGGRSLEAPGRWLAQHRGGARHGLRRESRGRKGDYLVARREPAHAATKRAHHARDLHAQRRAGKATFERFIR
jgi:hypothetical protein